MVSLWGEMSWSRSALPEVNRAKQGSSLWGEMFWSRSALLEVGRAKRVSPLCGSQRQFMDSQIFLRQLRRQFVTHGGHRRPLALIGIINFNGCVAIGTDRHQWPPVLVADGRSPNARNVCCSVLCVHRKGSHNCECTSKIAMCTQFQYVRTVTCIWTT